MPSSASSLKSHSQLIRWTSPCFLRRSQWAICPLWSSSPVRSNFHHPFRVFHRMTRETNRKISKMEICSRVVFCPRFCYFLILEIGSLFLFFLPLYWKHVQTHDLFFSWKNSASNLPLAILNQIKPTIKVIVERKPIDIDACPFTG